MAKSGAIRLSQEVVDAHQAKMARTRSRAAAPVAIPNVKATIEQQLGDALNAKWEGVGAAKGKQALGRLPVGTMNKTEAEYDAILAADPTILWRKFEAINLRLAVDTFYRADFFVMRNDGALEVHEVKGGVWEDDARVKIKVAAALYPFQFIGMTKLPKKLGGGWKREEF